MKSFLLIGQSNMAGRGFNHEVPPIYNERIMMRKLSMKRALSSLYDGNPMHI